MEYNTSRSKMSIPEYGRFVHQMVEYILTIQDKEEKKRGVYYLLNVMSKLNSQQGSLEDYKHKLWDQLNIMSGFKLNVKIEYPAITKEEVYRSPDKLSYPKKNENYRYYGHYIQEMINEVLNWEEGEKKEAMKWIIANHMKKCYLNWNKDTVDDKTIFEHLRMFSKGQIDLKSSETVLTNIQADSNIQSKRKYRTRNQKKYKNRRK